MAKHSTSVRCVLCGYRIEVALAIGQMLKCPSYGTNFMAPVETSTHSEASESEEPGMEERERPIVVPATATPQDVSATQATVSAAEIEMPRKIVRTSPAQAGDAVDPGVSRPTERAAEGEGDFRGDRRRAVRRLVIAVASVAALLGAVMFLAKGLGKRRRAHEPHVQRSTDESARSSADASRADDSENDEPITFPPFRVRFSAARDRAQRIGHVRVRVRSIRYASVTAKTQANVVTQTAPFLQVELEIENRSTKVVSYASWYGGSFEWRGQKIGAMLVDQSGRSWPLVLFDDARSIRGHTPRAELQPRDRVVDVVIFEPPDDTARAQARSWRLFLPAQAIGYDGGYGFHFDTSDVQGWQP